jgi:hypothetical protein
MHGGHVPSLTTGRRLPVTDEGISTMRRRHAILAGTAGAAMLGGLLLAPQAQAEPSLCVDLDVSIQDQGLVQSICLPPEGGGTPELPGAPGLPALP